MSLPSDPQQLKYVDRLGDRSIIEPSVEFYVENPMKDGRGIFIGEDCYIFARNRFVLGNLASNSQANLVIGDRVKINVGGYISAEGGLTIGDHALIGPHVRILSAGHAYDDPDRFILDQGLTYGPIAIGQDAWIGAGSIILQGRSVGEGAVIGAGSVVNRDVPPYAVAIGNPVRVVRYREKNNAAESAGSGQQVRKIGWRAAIRRLFS